MQTRPSMPASGAASFISDKALAALLFAKSEVNPWILIPRGQATWHGLVPFLSIIYVEGAAFAPKSGVCIALYVFVSSFISDLSLTEHSA